MLSGWHSDAQYSAAIQQAAEGDSGPLHRHDGLRGWFRELHDVCDDLDTEILEVRDLGDQLVVVFVIHGRGSRSGLANENTLAQVVTVRQGKISKARDYRSRAEALEAVGLRE